MAQVGQLVGAALAGAGAMMVYMQLSQKPDPSVEAQMPPDVKVTQKPHPPWRRPRRAPGLAPPPQQLAPQMIRPLARACGICRVRSVGRVRQSLWLSSGVPDRAACCAELEAEEDSDECWPVPDTGKGRRCQAKDASNGQHGGVYFWRVGRCAQQGGRRPDVSELPCASIEARARASRRFESNRDLTSSPAHEPRSYERRASRSPLPRPTMRACNTSRKFGVLALTGEREQTA